MVAFRTCEYSQNVPHAKDQCSIAMGMYNVFQIPVIPHREVPMATFAFLKWLCIYVAYKSTTCHRERIQWTAMSRARESTGSQTFCRGRQRRDDCEDLTAPDACPYSGTWFLVSSSDRYTHVFGSCRNFVKSSSLRGRPEPSLTCGVRDE